MAEIFDVYISASALEGAERVMGRAAAQGKEAMGLLVGDVRSWKGRQYVAVEKFITSKNTSTAVSVKFSEAAFAALARAYMRNFKQRKLIVGWLHSHPSYGCFLSGTDVRTQQRYFSEPFNIAMVVDPLRRGGGRMDERVFRVEGGSFYEVSFAVVEKK